jgi:hypothetical protein
MSVFFRPDGRHDACVQMMSEVTRRPMSLFQEIPARPTNQGPDATTYLSGGCHNLPITDICKTAGRLSVMVRLIAMKCSELSSNWPMPD